MTTVAPNIENNLVFAVANLRSEVHALRSEVAYMRKEMAPLLRWKTGVLFIAGLIVTLGFLARAVDWIIQLIRVR